MKPLKFGVHRMWWRYYYFSWSTQDTKVAKEQILEELKPFYRQARK